MATTYVALLRGINVGGKNRVLMADLRSCFESAGYADVRTYIQSGNVVFRTTATGRAELTAEIERILAKAFGHGTTVELRDLRELRTVVQAAPAGFGSEPDRYRYDVLFLMPPLTPEESLDALTLKEGVDGAWAGPGVVYASRVSDRASQSGLSRIASHPFYQRMTIRSWRTTTRLLVMMEPG
jgi:uncharacterized protein (DUF1697 family)